MKGQGVWPDGSSGAVTVHCSTDPLQTDGPFVPVEVLPASISEELVEALEIALDLAERAHGGKPRTGEDYHAHRDAARSRLIRYREAVGGGGGE